MDYPTYDALLNAVHARWVEALSSEDTVDLADGLYEAFLVMRLTWVKADREKWGE